MTKSMIGLRFKLNSSDLVDPDTLLFHRFGLKKLELNKFNNLDMSSEELKELSRNTLVNFIDYELLANKASLFLKVKLEESAFISYLTNLKNDLNFLAKLFLSAFVTTVTDLIDALPTVETMTSLLTSNSFVHSISSGFFSYPNNSSYARRQRFENFANRNDNIISSYNELLDYRQPNWDNSAVSNKFTESIDNSQRFNRFYNSLINYDYKTGNYVGYWEGKYPHLVNVFIEIARGVKKPS
jgi:hypothetical protein